MKRNLYFIVVCTLPVLFGISCSTTQKVEPPQPIENAPKLEMVAAIQIAQSYLEQSGVDTTQHYLDNVRLENSSSWMKVKHWIITWEPSGPRPVMGGQIFLLVDMDGNIKKMGGI